MEIADSKFDNNIFALAQTEMEQKGINKTMERTCIVVGEKGVGKTTLIAALIGEEVKAERKPTAGLDYKYATKKVEAKKVVGNFHELGGGRLLADLLETPLNASKLGEMVVVIVVDMSQPDSVLYHLDFWLKQVRDAANKALEELDSSNPVEANKLRELNSKKWEGHVDARRVFPIPIPTIIVGTKYDVFGIEEPENKKWMCRALRFFAHSNGWDLTFWSYREKDFDQLKLLVLKHVYGSNKEPKIQVDHGKILCVQEGQDKLTSIGDPPVPGEMSLDQAWAMGVENYFPLKKSLAEENDEKELGDISKFSEPKIDAMRLQKDEELERYRKETAMKKRFEAQKKGGKIINKKIIKKVKQPTTNEEE